MPCGFAVSCYDKEPKPLRQMLQGIQENPNTYAAGDTGVRLHWGYRVANSRNVYGTTH